MIDPAGGSCRGSEVARAQVLLALRIGPPRVASVPRLAQGCHVRFAPRVVPRSDLCGERNASHFAAFNPQCPFGQRVTHRAREVRAAKPET